jgi:hypothetical protein
MTILRHAIILWYDNKIYAGRAPVAGHPTCGSCYAIGIIVPGTSILTAIKATYYLHERKVTSGTSKKITPCFLLLHLRIVVIYHTYN